MEMAIALARRFTGTDSRIRVLIGPVGRKSRNIAEARQLIARTVFESADLWFAELSCAPDDPELEDRSGISHGSHQGEWEGPDP